MDPLRPVDPDEEVPRNTPEKPDANDSYVETPAEIQSAAAPDRRPADDRTELIDDRVGPEPDSIISPIASETSATNFGPATSDGADVVPKDAAPEPQAVFFDSAPVAAEAGPLLDAQQLPTIELTDTAPRSDVMSPPDNRGADASANRAIPDDSWSDSSSAFYAALQQTPLPVIDPGITDAASPSLDTGSFTDRSSLTVDQKPSRERASDDRDKRDSTAPVKDGESDQADPQPDAAPVERKEDANRRAEIERFFENFKAQTARADALLSPPFDGGPPMVRPIVLVSLDEEGMQSITNDVLAESGSRLAKTAAEIAEDKVNEAFWLRDCEMRALYRGR